MEKPSGGKSGHWGRNHDTWRSGGQSSPARWEHDGWAGEGSHRHKPPPYRGSTDRWGHDDRTDGDAIRNNIESQGSPRKPSPGPGSASPNMNSSTKSRGRGRGRGKRPDVQIYVPRGRRAQQENLEAPEVGQPQEQNYKDRRYSSPSPKIQRKKSDQQDQHNSRNRRNSSERCNDSEERVKRSPKQRRKSDQSPSTLQDSGRRTKPPRARRSDETGNYFDAVSTGMYMDREEKAKASQSQQFADVRDEKSSSRDDNDCQSPPKHKQRRNSQDRNQGESRNRRRRSRSHDKRKSVSKERLAKKLEAAPQVAPSCEMNNVIYPAPSSIAAEGMDSRLLDMDTYDMPAEDAWGIELQQSATQSTYSLSSMSYTERTLPPKGLSDECYEKDYGTGVQSQWSKYISPDNPGIVGSPVSAATSEREASTLVDSDSLNIANGDKLPLPADAALIKASDNSTQQVSKLDNTILVSAAEASFEHGQSITISDQANSSLEQTVSLLGTEPSFDVDTSEHQASEVMKSSQKAVVMDPEPVRMGNNVNNNVGSAEEGAVDIKVQTSEPPECKTIYYISSSNISLEHPVADPVENTADSVKMSSIHMELKTAGSLQEDGTSDLNHKSSSNDIQPSMRNENMNVITDDSQHTDVGQDGCDSCEMIAEPASSTKFSMAMEAEESCSTHGDTSDVDGAKKTVNLNMPNDEMSTNDNQPALNTLDHKQLHKDKCSNNDHSTELNDEALILESLAERTLHQNSSINIVEESLCDIENEMCSQMEIDTNPGNVQESPAHDVTDAEGGEHKDDVMESDFDVNKGVNVSRDEVDQEMSSEVCTGDVTSTEFDDKVSKNNITSAASDSMVSKNEVTQEDSIEKVSKEDVTCEGIAAEEDTWDALFDDDGEALDPTILDELTAAVGKVTVQKPQFDYYNYQTKDPELDDDTYGHLIEIYDFSSELVTRDLMVIFKDFNDRGFDLKWVDDTHAIGMFSSELAAKDALSIQHPMVKVRPISQASKPTKIKAKRSADFLEPYKPRPETNAFVARNLVAKALGIKTQVPKEKRDEERKRLREAKEQKRAAARLKRDAWEGTIGKCAMDDES